MKSGASFNHVWRAIERALGADPGSAEASSALVAAIIQLAHKAEELAQVLAGDQGAGELTGRGTDDIAQWGWALDVEDEPDACSGCGVSGRKLFEHPAGARCSVCLDADPGCDQCGARPARRVRPAAWHCESCERSGHWPTELIRRYGAAASRIWALFPSDPLPPEHPASALIERLEALIELGLIRPIERSRPGQVYPCVDCGALACPAGIECCSACRADGATWKKDQTK